jgi:predicted nucleic acid-binding protein
MKIFIDTSAFLAVLNVNDKFHQKARQAWDEILSSDATLFSSNYILLETIALLHSRFGIEAVRLFVRDILPVVGLIWVNQTIHEQGMSALLVANHRMLSLADCTSFEIMRLAGLDLALTFDLHFHDQGFNIIPTIAS